MMKITETTLHAASLTIILVIILIVFIISSLTLVPSFRYRLFITSESISTTLDPVAESEMAALKKKAENLRINADRLSSSANSFLIINTSDNNFRLYKNRQMIRSGLCSTGSLIHLEVDSTRSWIFETPRGVLQVRNKIVNPVWRKPDWAFIEDGLQPPPPGHPSRFERGVLGDYALDLGNGYLIHGTLYQRLLGRPVTHGCVRLNDSDLELVYQTLNIGSKVYIY
jgi:hypothetical protein